MAEHRLIDHISSVSKFKDATEAILYKKIGEKLDETKTQECQNLLDKTKDITISKED